MPSYLKKRGNKYHFQKRVPQEYLKYFRKSSVQISLKTEARALALQRAHSLNVALERHWSEMREAETQDFAEQEINDVITQVRKLGFKPITKDTLVNDTSVEEFISRIKAAYEAKDIATKIAILDSPNEQSEIRFSKARDAYLAFEEGNLSKHSEDQLRKWRNPKKKAAKNFIKVIGDKSVGDITRQDMLEFRRWWIERIAKENLSTTAANKEFTTIKKIVKNANNDHMLGLPTTEMFAETRLKQIEKVTRHPFSNDYIQNVLMRLKTDGLNEEARLLIFAMIETGGRIKELTGLEPDDVLLDREIPHIKIRPNNTRNLKTSQSERDIPLVGASLFAFQVLRGPFKHYHGKSDLISSTINKYFRENNLMPSKHHSLYSLRHSFEDRLTAVETPEKIQAILMGHKYNRVRYGLGPSLEQKRRWLNKIVLQLPH